MNPYVKCVLALVTGPVLTAASLASARAQEPAAWGDPLQFHTFSIAAVDPETGESAVAVTTRVPCVGNGVPWVRAGVGAVATQAWTRTEYGPELLQKLADGRSAKEALEESVKTDERAAFRQVGVIGLEGGSAQHTGEETNAWAGHRAGEHYVTQGNLLVGPGVLEAVAESFESTASSSRHLADRVIAALEAGQAAGGDARKGRLQSAAVVVADPRPGRSRRPDGLTANIHVCEHPTPVAEVRRVYDTISQTLGYRTLQQQAGGDVWQLKLILHALGYYHPDDEELSSDETAFVYDGEAVAAVDRFRKAQGLSTPQSGSPPGLVDGETLRLLWRAVEEKGQVHKLRQRFRELTAVRR